MEVVLDIVVLGALARAFMAIGRVYGRVSPAGLLSGLFTAPTLGWPIGVQEEDRDRAWSWSTPTSSPVVPGPDLASEDGLPAGRTEDFAQPGAIEDIASAQIPVRRVR